MLASIESLLIIALMFMAGSGFGHRLIKWTRLAPEWCATDRFLFETGLGIGCISLLLLAVGLSGLFYTSAIWSVIVLAGLVGWDSTLKSALTAFRLTFIPWKAMFSQVRYPHTRARGLWLLALLILAVVYSVCVLSGALAPPADSAYDVLTYHFGVPQLYLRWHAIRYTPYIPHANFPQLLEMLYACGLCLHLLGIQAVHFVFGMLAGAVCWRLARPYGRVAACLALLIFWFTPIVGLEASVGYDDLTFAFYEGLAVLAVVRWSEKFDGKWIVMAGIGQGLAMSVKYSAMALVIPLAVLVFAFAWQKDRKAWVQRSADALWRSGLSAVLIAAPWYLRTVIWTRNPVFPYFYSVLGGRNWSQAAADYYRTLQLGYGTGHSFTDILLAPMHLVIFAFRYYEPAGSVSFGMLFGNIGPCFLLLVGVAVAIGVGRGTPRVLLLLFAVFFVEWYLLMQQVRYLVESLPLLTPLCAVALVGDVPARQKLSPVQSMGSGTEWVQAVAAGIITLVFCWTTFCMVILCAMPERGGTSALLTAVGVVSPEDYLSDWLPDLWPVSHWVAENTPQNAKIAVIGEPRCFYMNRDDVWANGYEQTAIKYADMRNPGDLIQSFHVHRITYVVARVGTALGLVAGYGRLPVGRPAAWSDIDFSHPDPNRPNPHWLWLYAQSVKQGLLLPVYPEVGVDVPDAGGYVVYKVVGETGRK